MAISRHDPEWKRVIATALLAGVRLQQTHAVGRHGKRWIEWHAAIPGYGWQLKGVSKYAVAKHALELMETDNG